jgi:hypothetical protein
MNQKEICDAVRKIGPHEARVGFFTRYGLEEIGRASCRERV